MGPNEPLLDRLEALEKEVETLRALVYRDPLTGLRNRRYFDERVHEECCRAQRQNRDFSLLLLDIDDFKALNDRSGHLAGDRALIWIGMLLEDVVRTQDICCRVGGDEFVVIVVDADRATADGVRSRINEAFLRSPDPRKPPGISIGLAVWPTDGLSTDALIEAADRDMYRAKTEHHRRSDSQSRGASSQTSDEAS